MLKKNIKITLSETIEELGLAYFHPLYYKDTKKKYKFQVKVSICFDFVFGFINIYIIDI